MTRQLANLFITLLCFCSCRQQSNTPQLQAINESLGRSNEFLMQQNSDTYKVILDKLYDIRTSEYAEKWAPKAETVYSQCKSLSVYIDNLANAGNEKPVSANDANELFKKLIEFNRMLAGVIKPAEFVDIPYYNEVLKKDSSQLSKSLPLFAAYRRSSDSVGVEIDEKTWMQNTFSDADTAMCQTLLSKIKNDVLFSTKIMIDYCNDQSRSTRFSHDYMNFSGLCFLSSSYIKPGDTIEVTSGIGHFSGASQPRITIDGKNTELNQAGVAVYRFRPMGKPGKYRVPVTIEFYSPGGNLMKVHKQLSYTIAQ